MSGMLKKMQQIASHDAPPPPIAELIGFTMTSVEFGIAIFEFQATPRHANPMGTLHGGVLCDRPTPQWARPISARWKRARASRHWN